MAGATQLIAINAKSESTTDSIAILDNLLKENS